MQVRSRPETKELDQWNSISKERDVISNVFDMLFLVHTATESMIDEAIAQTLIFNINPNTPFTEWELDASRVFLSKLDPQQKLLTAWEEDVRDAVVAEWERLAMFVRSCSNGKLGWTVTWGRTREAAAAYWNKEGWHITGMQPEHSFAWGPFLKAKAQEVVDRGL
jgi:hypothetical protein